MGIVYKPFECQAISPNKRVIDFFCGDELNDIASIILQLEFGLITPQAAYLELIQKTLKSVAVECEIHKLKKFSEWIEDEIIDMALDIYIPVHDLFDKYTNNLLQERDENTIPFSNDKDKLEYNGAVNSFTINGVDFKNLKPGDKLNIRVNDKGVVIVEETDD